jgi:predicted AlkP superfamily pyrophosphatase or phosphodiesterase
LRNLIVINMVGMTTALLEHAPNLRRITEGGACAPMSSILPAVTCSVQASLLTGLSPQDHGAVGNGWMDPASREVALWRQANTLVSGEKLYETVKRLNPNAITAKLFWWWNMGAAVDLSITPRPHYPADGRKIVDTYASPSSYGEDLKERLGDFPFFDFWGPRSGLPSSRWIADAAIQTLERHTPALSLVYLPHLDYDHQRFGPHDPRSIEAVKEADVLVGEIADAAERVDTAVMVISEYGIQPVSRPVEINRALRRAGLLSVRQSPVGEALDVFASRAFAVVDHQLAHIYCDSPSSVEAAREALSDLPGVASLHAGEARAELGLDHARAGDIIALSERDAWFHYPYWIDEDAAPDFAPTVDIHNKPGYDPCELFIDPKLKLPALRVARRLAQKKLGFRTLMDVVSQDPTQIRGSHGLLPESPQHGPIFACSLPFSDCGGDPNGVVDMLSFRERALALMQLS